MEPQTILHIIDSLNTGGAEQQLASHLQYADRTRFRHAVCSLAGSARFAEVLEAFGIPVFSLGLAPHRDFLRGVMRFQRVVRDVSPALLHATLFRAGVISRVVGKLTGLPVITSLVSPTYEPAWRIDNPYLNGRKVDVVRLVDRLTSRVGGTWFVAISHAVKDSAVQQMGIPPDRISVIPRGLPVSEPSRPSEAAVTDARSFLGGPDAYPIILNVGRLVPQKGQRYAIAAMPGVVAAHPKARLVIVGEGWLRSELETQIRALGVQNHVVLAGERRDVNVLMQAADLFTFPSLSEGFGVALLEALGAGRPCIVSRIPALTEVTDGGKVALLVDARSPEALAAGIIRLAGDRQLAARLGDEAATFVRERYNVVTSMRRLEELYGTLVDRPVHAGRVSVSFQ